MVYCENEKVMPESCKAIHKRQSSNISGENGCAEKSDCGALSTNNQDMQGASFFPVDNGSQKHLQ
jgi:hypothetical protein